MHSVNPPSLSSAQSVLRLHRPPAGLLADGRFLQKPLPGRASATRSGRSPAGVPRDPSDCHPGAEESHDQAHLRWPLHVKGESLPPPDPVWLLLVRAYEGSNGSFGSCCCRASRPGWPLCTCPSLGFSRRTCTGSMWRRSLRSSTIPTM